MKNIRLITILLIFTVLIGAFLIFSLGSPILLGQASSETKPIFGIRIIDFQSPVRLGEFLEFSYSTRGVLGVDDTAKTTFWIEKGGEVITSGSDVIFLGLEEKERVTKIFIPSSFKSGIYELKMEVDYKGHVERAYRTIEVYVEGGFATINLGFGKANITFIFLLILLAILNIYIIYHFEKKKIKEILQKEERFVKGHKISLLTVSFFIILGVLVYYLDLIGFLPNIPLYYYYLILGVLLLLVLFFVGSKRHLLK